MLEPVDGKDTDPRLMEALMFEARRRLRGGNLIFVAAFAAGCSAAGHQNPGGDGGDADLSSPGGPGPGGDMAMGTTGSGERIDDLDHCSASIKNIGTPARKGAWYTYSDMMAGGAFTNPSGMTFTPSMGSSSGMGCAARIAGDGFNTWGAAEGFNLLDPSKLPYDASAYKGITFKAKANVAMSLRVNFPNKDTDMSGLVCTKCSDDFGADVAIGTAWQQYTVKFVDVAAAGWGMPQPASFDVKTIYSIHFQVKTMPFDLSIDSIDFLK